MRCPVVLDPEAIGREVDIGILGVPFDGGVTNRPGARHGPRGIRDNSSLTRAIHNVTKVNPYDLARVADVGDVPFTSLFDLEECHRNIVDHVTEALVEQDATVLGVGGDHSITYPLLMATAGHLAGPAMAGGAGAPMGCVHVDAHSDTWDEFYGSKLHHGAPFRRAVEAGLLDPTKIVQVGIRGAQNFDDGWRYCEDMGITVIWCEDVHREGIEAAVAKARSIVDDCPAVYVSFDIDAIDPAYCPGTGTPEIGGMHTWQALELLRGLRGLNIVGADLVEVAPPWDPSNLTSITGGTILYELLCLLAESRGLPAVEDWRKKRLAKPE
eukprot:g2085.t1